MAACAALGALLPDLDAGAALAAQLSLGKVRPLAPISAAMRGIFGHRGVMHSLVGIAVFAGPVAVLAWIWLGLGAAVALLLGYASHLAADAYTVSGIPALYPDKSRRFLLPRSARIVTGSFSEDVILLAAGEACVALLLTIMRAL